MLLLSHTVDKKLAQTIIKKLIVTSFNQHQQQQQHHHHHHYQQQQQQLLLPPRQCQYFNNRGISTTVTNRLNNYNNNNNNNSNMSEKSFLPKKALVLRKFSRLEYERRCHQNLSEEQLIVNDTIYLATTRKHYADITHTVPLSIRNSHIKLSKRGFVYDSLIHYDQIQKSCLRQIESVLATNGIEYQTVDRFGYTEDRIDWADVIITSGGDGTFLLAASKIVTRDKPVIGVNSDPTKSVGHLCLPSKYSDNFDKVIELLKSGKYQWQYKQRLRVTLVGEAADEEPLELNDIRYNILSLRGMSQFLDHNDNQEHNPLARSSSPTEGSKKCRVRQLKERALNEVFVGETLSAKVSYYELSVDKNKMIKMKSSGLTICTGTGSTSWYYNINKITEEQMQSIVSIINDVTKTTTVQPTDTEVISDITRHLNEALTFPGTELKMAYSIRDPVDYASRIGISHRGNARRIEVKSRMQNACLVLDGGQFYPFNDGSYAIIEMFDEDALKTISIEAS